MRQILAVAITVAVWWLTLAFTFLDWAGPLAVESASLRFFMMFALVSIVVGILVAMSE